MVHLPKTMGLGNYRTPQLLYVREVPIKLSSQIGRFMTPAQIEKKIFLTLKPNISLLMKFRGDNRRQRVLTADKIEETGKMKILQITNSVSMSDTVIYDIKAKKTSSTNLNKP